jgi:hypothetical protein
MPPPPFSASKRLLGASSQIEIDKETDQVSGISR